MTRIRKHGGDEDLARQRLAFLSHRLCEGRREDEESEIQRCKYPILATMKTKNGSNTMLSFFRFHEYMECGVLVL